MSQVDCRGATHRYFWLWRPWRGDLPPAVFARSPCAAASFRHSSRRWWRGARGGRRRPASLRDRGRLGSIRRKASWRLPPANAARMGAAGHNMRLLVAWLAALLRALITAWLAELRLLPATI